MTDAVVAAGDRQAAQAGYDILSAGGNAIDAVCAAAFASWVVEPPLGSPAGAGLLLHGSRDRSLELVDFFTRVPGLGLGPVDPNTLDFHAVTVDYGPTTQDFHVGRGSAALPTCVYGLVQTHGRHGNLPLRELVAPAIDLARNGWVLSPHIQWVFRLLSPILTLTPSVQSIHCVDGHIAPANATLFNRPLADFLEALGRDGMSFLRGDWTDVLVREFGPEAGGRLTRADLETIEVSARKPLSVPFGRHEVHVPSPPASGGALVALGLALAERVGLPELEWLSPEWCRRTARVLYAVSNARTQVLDGHVFEPGIADRLLDDTALDDWARRASAEERHLGGTTHISVLTAAGECASFTMSNGEGCGHAVESFGIHVNNFLGEEDINPEGFHRVPAGRPMTTMMTPTVATLDGRPVMVSGTGGANRIRSIMFLHALARLGHGVSLEQAARAPRMHVEGEQLWLETLGLSEEAVAAVQGEWSALSTFDTHSMFFGGVNAAAWDGALSGHGDERRGGWAVGPR